MSTTRLFRCDLMLTANSKYPVPVTVRSHGHVAQYWRGGHIPANVELLWRDDNVVLRPRRTNIDACIDVRWCDRGWCEDTEVRYSWDASTQRWYRSRRSRTLEYSRRMHTASECSGSPCSR